MKLAYVTASDGPEIRNQIAEAKKVFQEGVQVGGGNRLHPALIIDGRALTAVTANGAEPELLELARMCEAVIACRVSPGQKREVVAMVRAGVRPEPMTLAIGDGANDVPMITEAHVGYALSLSLS
jgi:magnesium-transporting ATPase (P-type)